MSLFPEGDYILVFHREDDWFARVDLRHGTELAKCLGSGFLGTVGKLAKGRGNWGYCFEDTRSPDASWSTHKFMDPHAAARALIRVVVKNYEEVELCLVPF